MGSRLMLQREDSDIGCEERLFYFSWSFVMKGVGGGVMELQLGRMLVPCYAIRSSLASIVGS